MIETKYFHRSKTDSYASNFLILSVSYTLIALSKFENYKEKAQ